MSTFFICLFTVAAYAQASETQMLERLHGALDLTSTQETGWKTLEQAYAIDPREIAQRRDTANTMPTLTAPQRVDLSINLMKADLAAQERRGEALKTFYSTLSPQQQGIFNRDTLSPGNGRY
jgi:hypothetical protein